MVPSATLWPSARHFSAERRTSISTLSMRKCYPNSAPASGAIGDGDGRAVARRDFAHDGEAEAAAGARRAGHAIEALEHPLALLPRDAWAVVLDLQERGSIAPAGA